MYTKPDKPDYIDTKGIQLVRRDNCPLVKDVSTDILNAIMHDKNPDAALEVARQHIARVLAGGVPIDKFVVSKTLRGGYKNAAQPHVYVADKIRRRRGYPVNHGERVPYVFIQDLTKPDGLQAERAEDPKYAEEHDLPLDVRFYIQHQLQSPIVSLLELMVDDAEAAVFGDDRIAPLMAALDSSHAAAVRVAKRVRKNVANHQLEITKWLVPGPKPT
jgi:DNA polymerase delta subunit 1